MSEKQTKNGTDKAPETETVAAQDAQKSRVIEALIIGLVERGIVDEDATQETGFDPVSAALKAIDQAAEESTSLKLQLRSQKGATTRVKNEIEEMQQRSRPRAIGTMKDALSPRELGDLILESDTVELAFSDGHSEIAGLAPVSVPSDAFTMKRGRLSLDTDSLKIRMNSIDGSARPLVGYGLLIEGEQIAWAERLGGQLMLTPGVTYEIGEDVVFT